MKKLHFFSLLCFLFLLGACKSKDKKTDETTTDTTGTVSSDTSSKLNDNTTTVSPMGPSHVMVIRHKVAGFEKWLPVYEGSDSTRLSNGIHQYLIARGIDADSNTVLVAMTYDDLEKAKARTSSPELKAAMKKAGVVGQPTINFLEAEMNDTTAHSATVRLMVRHKVKDYAAWKKIFDSDKNMRMSSGITDRVLAHEAGDPNTVVVVFAISDLEKAKAFGNSPELKAKMDSAGVVGKPDFFYYRVVKKYM
jgi:hypothetical protein